MARTQRLSYDENVVVLSGNLTVDPTVNQGTRQDGSGVSIIHTHMCSHWGDNNVFFPVTYFDPSMNFAQYLQKGRKILIHGRLEYEEWPDKQTGEPRNRLLVIAQRVFFMGGPMQQNQAQGGAQTPVQQPAPLGPQGYPQQAVDALDAKELAEYQAFQAWKRSQQTPIARPGTQQQVNAVNQQVQQGQPRQRGRFTRRQQAPVPQQPAMASTGAAPGGPISIDESDIPY